MDNSTAEHVARQINRLLVNPNDAEATEELAKISGEVLEFFSDPASFAIFEHIRDDVDPKQLERIFTILATLTSGTDHAIGPKLAVDEGAARRLEHNQKIVDDVESLLAYLKTKGVDIIRWMEGVAEVDGAERDYLLANPALARVKDRASSMARFGLTHWNLFGALRAIELLADRRLRPLASPTEYDNLVLRLDKGTERNDQCEILRKSAVREICQFADCDRALASGLLGWMQEAVGHVPHLFVNLYASIQDDKVLLRPTSTPEEPRSERWQIGGAPLVPVNVRPAPADLVYEILSKCDYKSLKLLFDVQPAFDLTEDPDGDHILIHRSDELQSPGSAEPEAWAGYQSDRPDVISLLRALVAGNWRTIRLDVKTIPHARDVARILNEKAAEAARREKWSDRIAKAA